MYGSGDYDMARRLLCTPRRLHDNLHMVFECYLFPVDMNVRRITPNEWHDPQPWKDRNNELETKLNVANLIWFSCGTMLQQGSDISPQ